MNFERELKFHEENFRRARQSRQKSVPNFEVNNLKSDFAPVHPAEKLNFYYDVDGIIATGHIRALPNFAKRDLNITPGKRKHTSSDLIFSDLEYKFVLAELASFHLGHFNISSSLKLDIWLLSPRSIKIGSYLTQLLDNYKERIRICKGFEFSLFSFNNPNTGCKGIIDVNNFNYFIDSILEVIGAETFFHCEVFGTKKNFHSPELAGLKGLVSHYLNVDFPTLLFDFCFSVTTFEKNMAIFPKSTLLSCLGINPNYFPFFATNCPNVSRKTNLYFHKNLLTANFQIMKTNFYSSIQDCFGKFTSRKYYPEISKALLHDLLRGESDQSGYSLPIYREKLLDYKDVITSLELFDTNTVINYRFEFRLPAVKIENLGEFFSPLIKDNFFLFYKVKDLIEIVTQNLKVLYEAFEKNPKSLLEVANTIFLETLFISSCLRGDIFKFPFSTKDTRAANKKLFSQSPGKISTCFINECISNLDKKFITSEFIKSLNFLSEIEREVCNWVFDISTIFQVKELFILEIQTAVFSYSRKNEQMNHYCKLHPRFFFEEIYVKNLTIEHPAKLLIPIYKQLYPEDDIFQKIFSGVTNFYYEDLNLNFEFSNKVLPHNETMLIKEKYFNFISYFERPKRFWGEEETNELIFASKLFLLPSGEVSVNDLMQNFSFSFHLTRNKNSVRKKLKSIDMKRIVSFKFFSLEERFKIIEKQTMLKLSAKFMTEYKRLVMNDMICLGLVQ